jgi:uncharacterized protein YwqG
MPKHLREFRMKFERVSDGETAYSPDHDEALGFRSKLGGKPDWDQGDQTPKCSGCQKPMRFIAQIDSIEHSVGKNPHRQEFFEQEYMFGDVGMLYVFFCYDCMETKSVFQCG